MLDEYKRVKIKGHENAGVLIFMDEDGEGPLTTIEEFASFVPGYAHVSTNGNIMRYGQVIGTKDDLIEVIEARDE